MSKAVAAIGREFDIQNDVALDLLAALDGEPALGEDTVRLVRGDISGLEVTI